MHLLRRLLLVCLILLASLFVLPRQVFAYYNNMSASVVVGQSDFTSGSVNQGGSAAANTLNSPEGVYYDPGSKKLFIADTENNRVLVFNSLPSSLNVSADVVIGQADFASSSANQGGSAGANTLDSPTGVYVVNNRLLIADGDNDRVLIYNSIPTQNNASADIVIGQSDFTSSAHNQCSCNTPAANTLFDPHSVTSDGQKLYITDGSNNRVLIYNSIPTQNNASADVVLGQSDFTTRDANQGGISAGTLSAPRGLLVADSKLLVGDVLNFRVLIWNSIPTTNKASADVVIGQPNFVSNGSQAFGYNTRRPYSIAYDGKRLFLVHDFSAAVSIRNDGIPASNFTPHDVTIGVANVSSPLDASHMWEPRGITVGENKLIIADSLHYHRVLIFNNVLSGPQLSMNTPEQIANSKLKVSGSVQLGERPRYALQRMQANVNGQGFSNVTNLGGGTDDGTDKTRYEFFHEFEPWAGISAKDQYDPSKGYTLNLKASSFNAEEDNLFYFQPFQLTSVSGNTLNIKLNKDHWDRIKNNLDSFEIQTKKGTVWKTLQEKIALNSESITTSKTLSGEIRLVAKDKWGHRQSVTNSVNTGLSLSSYNLNTNTVTPNFPLQISSVSGFNTGIISTYQSVRKKSFVGGISKPTFLGIAYTGSQVTVLVTDPVIGRSTVFTTTTKTDSKWNLPVTLYSSSVIDTWVILGDKYTELPTFKLTQVRSEQ